MIKEYYRLVRDKIPEIMRKEGKQVSTAQLSEKEYASELNLKLLEEVNQLVLDSTAINTYVDIIEILKCKAMQSNLDWTDIVAELDQKSTAKGSFINRIFLLKTDDV